MSSQYYSAINKNYVYDSKSAKWQGVALIGRNRTGPPCSVGRPTAHAPGGRPARTPAALQTTTDTSQQNNTGPFGGPVIIAQEAQLLQMHRASHDINLNLLNCCIAVRKIPVEKACNKWMTLKVTQGQRKRRSSISHTLPPIYDLYEQRLYRTLFLRYHQLLDHPQQGIALTRPPSLPPPIVFGFKPYSLDRLFPYCAAISGSRPETASLNSDVARCWWCQSCQAGHCALQPSSEEDSHAHATPGLHLFFIRIDSPKFEEVRWSWTNPLLGNLSCVHQ